MNVSVPISPGELLDKVTILEVKKKRIRDKRKQASIRAQLLALRKVLKTLPKQRSLKTAEKRLLALNAAQWRLEDDVRIALRRKETARALRLVHKIHLSNDRRAALKKKVDVSLGSDFVEEKSYAK